MKNLSKLEIAAGILGPFLLLFFVLFYVFIFSFFLPSKAVNIEIEEELANIKAKGEPVTLEELAPPLIPDEENSAFIYEEVSEKIGEIPCDIEGLLSKLSSELTSEEKTTLEKFLNEKEEAISLLDRAMAYKKCRFPINYEEGYNAEFPHLKYMRKCARLLALESLCQAKKGDVESAVDTSLKIMKISESLSFEPTLISQLVKIAIGGIMINSLEKILSEGNISIRTLEELIDVLEIYREDMSKWLKLAYIGERCLFIETFQKLEYFFPKDTDIDPEKLKYVMNSRFFKSDLLYGIKIFGELISFTELPMNEAVNKSNVLAIEVALQAEEAMDGMPFKAWKLCELHIFSAMLLPALNKTFITLARNDARIQQTIIVSALKLYKIQYGEYPQNISDISPAIISSLPKDPFTSEDFIYRKQYRSFILYSVGENLEDEGGISCIKDEKGKKVIADIVWGEDSCCK